MDANGSIEAGKQGEAPKKPQSVKAVILEHFTGTTAHALPRVFRTGDHYTALKVIWLIFFLVSTSYCIKSIVVNLQNFLRYPSFISTSIAQEFPANFPAVTVCNLKSINKTAFDPIFNQYNLYSSIVDIATPLEMVLGFKILTGSVPDLLSFNAEEKKNMGYKLENMLLSCHFNYKTCNTSDFTYFYNPTFGNCYTFNKGVDNDGKDVKIKQIVTGGQFYGLLIELFTGGTLENETFLEYNDGLAISIHNQSAEPFSNGMIMIPTASDTNLEMTRNFIKKLGKPYGNCLEDTSKNSDFSSELFDFVVRTLGIEYYQSICFNLCLQRETVKTCNCSNAFLPSLKVNNNKSNCFYINEVGCMIQQMTDIVGDVDVLATCQRECPNVCETIEYETTTSRSSYPTKYYKKLLWNNTFIKDSGVKYEDLPEAVAKVNVFYKNMDYKVIEQKAQFTIEDFFSSTGGTLSLYIGISLLSFVEIIELLFRMILALINMKNFKVRKIGTELHDSKNTAN